MDSFWIPLLPFALFFAWLLVSNGRGVKRCPDCARPLPSTLSPFKKTRRQWVDGGMTCQVCGCEANFDGMKVPKGTAPDWGWLAVSLALPALALASAIYFSSLLLQR